jgi:hypothetical protein
MWWDLFNPLHLVFQAFIILLYILNPGLETWERENIHCHSWFQLPAQLESFE